MKFNDKLIAVKSIVNLNDLVYSRYGIMASNGRIACPFHNGTDKNMRIKERGFCCFVCGESGDSIRFVSLMEGINFGETVKLLYRVYYGNDPIDTDSLRKKNEERQIKRNICKYKNKEIDSKYRVLYVVERLLERQMLKESEKHKKSLEISEQLANYIILLESIKNSIYENYDKEMRDSMWK